MSESDLSLFAGFLFGYSVVMIAVAIFFLICNWKIFVKAGYEGWKCLIPFYNTYCMFEMFYGNGLSFLWLFCPFANIVVSIKYIIRMSHSFGWYGGKVLLTFLFSPIVIAIFAFSSNCEYLGPDGQGYDDSDDETNDDDENNGDFYIG